MQLPKTKTNFTILIVDDEAATRELLEFDFVGKGYTVFTASNGIEGLEVIKKMPIDLVVTDLRMPEFGGAKMLAEIRKMFNGSTPSVIVITGHFGMTVEEAMASGACQLLDKPFSRKTMLECVKFALTPLVKRWEKTATSFEEQLNIEVEIEDFDRICREGKLVFGWGGFFLHTPDLIPEVGQLIAFKFDIKKPENALLKGGGKVVWKRSDSKDHFLSGVGVEIVYFEAESMDQATKWLTASEIRSYIPNKAP